MHSATICNEHRSVLMQCKCPGPKIVTTVACPGEACRTARLMMREDGVVVWKAGAE